MSQLDPNGTQQEDSQQNSGQVHSLNKAGQTDKRTNGQTDKWTNTKHQTQTGPPFPDLMSGWIRLDSDNHTDKG